MIIQILIILFVIALAVSLGIKFTVFYHFKKFSLPQDPAVQKIINIHKLGTIVIASLCVLLLASIAYVIS